MTEIVLPVCVVQVRRVEMKAAKEKTELEERLLATNKKNMEALQAK